jgi:adenylate kinase
MKVVYMIGLPGCGKSTVMKEFMKDYDWTTGSSS